MNRSRISLCVVGVAVMVAGFGLIRASAGPREPNKTPAPAERFAGVEGFGQSGFGQATSDEQGGPPPPFPVTPFRTYTNCRFAINSVAMRDCKMGGINLVGPPPGSVIVDAWLYWQWACLDQPVHNKHDRVVFKQVFPAKVGAAVAGTLIGSSPNPCWCPAPAMSFTYRANVLALMSPTGGGTYGLILTAGAPGSVDYQDPWAPLLFPGCDPAPSPLFEGAALVVIYDSSCETNGTVHLYDSPLPSTMYITDPGISYDLLHPALPAAITQARWAQATCDGQVGFGYIDVPSFALENTFVNGVPVAGPGSPVGDSDVNGSAGKPLPQLYDTTGHDVTPLLIPGSPMTNITIFQPGGTDCLVTNLNLLFYF